MPDVRNVPDDPRTRPDLVLRGTVVTPTDVHRDGIVVVRGDLIVWVGPVPATTSASGSTAVGTGLPDGPVLPDGTRVGDLPAATDLLLLPGLVDLHCHGGGGESFPDALTLEAARTAAREHLRHGTTTVVASLVTADDTTLLERTALLADLADAGEIGGIHLEGPFLSPRRCGAQNPSFMQPGSNELVRRVAEVARGHLVTMTVAPEIVGVGGATGAVQALVAAGAVPSVGHTDGTAEVTTAGLAEASAALAAPGARSRRPTITHLFNGMPPLHHREPGPVAACLAAAARGEAVVELVADGVHLAAATVRAVFDLVGADAIALVTDAMAAAGMPDGSYRLGPLAVRVTGGVARSADGGAIAGGTAHLLDVVRWTVGIGVPLVDAVRAAATTPAAVLGRPDIGGLVAGLRADVVVADAALSPVAVLRRGRWQHGPQADEQRGGQR
ncbi:MAG: N-acetylglucosamine-6-phosphate deacetylase [Actinotalea sp.]|nr:N-acetylglucosamine-6-phosphate deacetylase [Actinotalea sp.]